MLGKKHNMKPLQYYKAPIGIAFYMGEKSITNQVHAFIIVGSLRNIKYLELSFPVSRNGFATSKDIYKRKYSINLHV